MIFMSVLNDETDTMRGRAISLTIVAFRTTGPGDGRDGSYQFGASRSIRRVDLLRRGCL
jgi:hypothetical protein